EEQAHRAPRVNRGPIAPAADGGLGARSIFLLAGHGDADDVRVKDHVRLDEALNVANGMAAMIAEHLTNQDQTVPGMHDPAKTDVIHAKEADKVAVQQTLRDHVVRTKLSSGLTHQNAGQERIAGHVATNPKLVAANVLVARDQLP